MKLLLMFLLFITIGDANNLNKEEKMCLEENNISICIKLGAKYIDGEEVKTDYNKAILFLEKAYKEGKGKEAKLAIIPLIETYYYGLKDTKKAKEYINELTNVNTPEQIFTFGQFFQQLTPNDYRLAKEFYEIAAKKGYTKAQLVLGSIYLLGKYGISQNTKEAIKWLNKAAEQNDAMAQFALSSIYLDKKLGFFNEDKAIYLLKKSANNNLPEAQYFLGNYYNNKKELKKAKYWLEKASKQGHTKAKELLDKLDYIKDKKNGIRYKNIVLNKKFNLSEIPKPWIQGSKITPTHYLIGMDYIYKNVYNLGKDDVYCILTMLSENGDITCFEHNENKIIKKLMFFKSYGATDLTNKREDLESDFIKELSLLKDIYGEFKCINNNPYYDGPLYKKVICTNDKNTFKVTLVLDYDISNKGGDIVKIYSVKD